MGDLDTFKQGGILQVIGERLDFESHSEIQSNQLVILMIDTHFQRTVNVVNYFPLDVEATCYNKNEAEDKSPNLNCNKILHQCIKDELNLI